MKKAVIFLLFLLVPVVAFADINQNLYYGLTNNSNVKQLQQYLISKGFLVGNATGNFYSATFKAVKKYQISKKLNATGYVGPLTRQMINNDLSFAANVVSPPTAIATIPNVASTPVPLSGSLDLVQNTSYVSQSVVAPRLKFKLADFTLTNNTNQAINLKTIEADFVIGTSTHTANQYVSNARVLYGDTTTSSLQTVSYQNYWTANASVAAGQSIGVSVYADVNASIPLGSTLNTSLLLTGSSASGTAVTTNSGAVLTGQSMTFAAGSLTVGQGGVLTSRLVVANQRVVAGSFQFGASNDSYVISELKFIVPVSSINSIIKDIVVSDTQTQIALTQKIPPTAYDNSNIVIDAAVNVPVLRNTLKSLTIFYDLGPVGNVNNTNVNIAPILIYVKASNDSGTLLDGAAGNYNNINSSYGGISLPDGGVVNNSVYIFKSVPTFTANAVSVNAKTGSTVDLYKFSISADPSGDVAVKQLFFTITIADPNSSYPHLNAFTFFKGVNDYTGAVIIGNDVNNLNTSLVNSGIGYGTSSLLVTFNKEEIIPAGSTQSYTLRAVVSNFISSSTLGADSISVTMPQDNVPSTSGNYLRAAFNNIYGLAPSPTSLSATPYNILWSDESATQFPFHSDSNGGSTNDWYNGFGLSHFPSTSQSIAAQ